PDVAVGRRELGGARERALGGLQRALAQAHEAELHLGPPRLPHAELERALEARARVREVSELGLDLAQQEPRVAVRGLERERGLERLARGLVLPALHV